LSYIFAMEEYEKHNGADGNYSKNG
jgi:hypothetical protein